MTPPEYIWTLPEVGASGPTGGDDGLGGYMPLAVSVGSGTAAALNWVHGNHMGVPLLTTNASGTAVTPTGYALSGFPGQFANAVLLPGAGHYYNRYRDYDPTTGRYIQADPIGLAGDENPYAYALGNPLRYTDPTGEAAWLVPVAAGFAIAAGVDLAIQAAENWFKGKPLLNPGNYNIGRAAIAGAFGGVSGGATAFWVTGTRAGLAGASCARHNPLSVLPTPTVMNPKLQNIVNNLYKGTTNPNRVGFGTTADAVRYERLTGLPVGNRFHNQKAEESVRGLKNWLVDNPSANFNDRVVANSLLDELTSALRNRP